MQSGLAQSRLRVISFQVGPTVGKTNVAIRVEEFVAQWWHKGEATIVDGRKTKSRTKVSAEAVQYHLTPQYDEGLIRLSEVPVVAKVSAVYQNIGQTKQDSA